MMLFNRFIYWSKRRECRCFLLAFSLPGAQDTTHLFNRFLRFDRADDRNDHAPGPKMEAMKPIQVFACDRLDRFHISIARPAIGMSRIKSAVKDQRGHV